MTLFNKRSRMVSIRLSDEEFKKLHDVCVATGARSVSDLAREAMHRMVDGGNGHGSTHDRLGEMQERLERMEAELARLAAAMGGGQ